MKSIELLKNSYLKNSIKQTFKIPVEDKGVKIELDVDLVYDDFFAVNEQMEDSYDEAYAKYAERGLDKTVPSRGKVNEYLKSLPENLKKVEEENLPESIADLRARKDARTNLIFDLIPKVLIEHKTGARVCNTPDDVEVFKKMLRANIDLINLIAENFGHLWKKVAELRTEAKNSSTPENSPS